MDRKYFSGVVFVALLFWLAADFAAWHRLSCLSEGKPTGDLAMFEEIYAAARHGTLFAGREASGPVYPRVHVAPVLALAFPPYLLNPAGGMLRIIVLENLGLALAGIVLFLLVRRSLSARGGAWLCLAFFTHLTVTSPLVVTEVQPLKWAPLFLLLLLGKVEERGAGYAALATVLVVAVRQDMGLILFLLGWYLLLRRYPYAWFLGLVGFSSVYLLAVVGVLIPWLLGPTPYPSLLRLSPWLSPTGEFLAHRGVYLLFLLFPWGLFFRWSDCRWLLLLPGLAINLNGLPHWSSLHWHYTLPLVPVLAWAALPGLRRVRNPERCCAGIALWSLGIFVARRVVWPFF